MGQTREAFDYLSGLGMRNNLCGWKPSEPWQGVEHGQDCPKCRSISREILEEDIQRSIETGDLGIYSLA